jgi:hypothetical protein
MVHCSAGLAPAEGQASLQTQAGPPGAVAEQTSWIEQVAPGIQAGQPVASGLHTSVPAFAALQRTSFNVQIGVAGHAQGGCVPAVAKLGSHTPEPEQVKSAQ